MKLSLFECTVIEHIKNPQENTNKLLELTSAFGTVLGNKSIYKNQLYFCEMFPKLETQITLFSPGL